MKDIILISGKMGSGKTTLSNSITPILEQDGFTVHPIIFAQTIYDIHDFALKLLAERGVIRDIVKDRKLLKVLGLDWGRLTIDTDVWVKTTRGLIEKTRRDLPGKKNVFIISDCRFRNEFDNFPDALRVRLECPEDIRKDRCTAWEDHSMHPSEIDLDNYSESNKFDLKLYTNTSKSDKLAKIVTESLLES